MSLKDQAINLVLSAKNLLSGSVDDAAKSVEQLSGSAQGLRGRLDQLEKQSGLISQFQAAEKAVDRTSLAYEKAQLRVDKMAEKIERSGYATATQAKEFELAQRAVDNAEKAYKAQQQTVQRLGDELQDAGLDVEQLGKAQGEIAGETKKAEKALAGYNDEVDEGEGRLKSLGNSLAAGATRFAAWAAAAAAAGAAAGTAVLVSMTAKQAELARQTLVTADAFGVSTTALQEWRYAGEAVGLEGDKVADIMKDVGDKIGDAFLNGSGAAVDVIQQLNLDLEELVALRPDEQLLKISEQLNGLPKAAQVQILESLAGDASLLLPLLENNAAALRELAAEAQKRGSILSEGELERLAEADKAFDRIKAQIDGFVKRVTGELAPAFEKLANDLDDFLLNNPQIIDNIVQKMQELVGVTTGWIKTFIDNRDEIEGTFRTMASGASGLLQTFVALFRGVQSFGAGTLEVFARAAYSVAELAASVTRGMNTIGLASAESVASAEARVENLGATVQDLEAKSEAYQRQMIEAGEAAATAFGDTKQAGQAAEASLDGAKGAASELNAALEGVAPATEKAATATVSLAQKQNELRLQLAQLVPQIRAAQDELRRDVTSENQGRLARLINQYEAVGGQIQKLNTIAGQTEENIRSSADVLSRGVKRAGEEVDETGSKAERAGAKFGGMANDVKGVGAAADEVGEKAIASAGTIGAAIANIFNGWSNYISALSEKAGAAFQNALGMGGAAGSASVLEQRLSLVNSRLKDMRQRLESGGTIGGLFRDMAKAGFETEQSFLEQAIAVEQLTDRLGDGDRSASLLAMSAADVARKFDLLDDNQLRPLIGAIQSAQREVESLNKSLESTIASARQELASLQGDTDQVEFLRFEQRRLELQNQYDYARKLGDREAMSKAKEALDLTEQAYNLRLKQSRARSDEASARALEGEQSKADDRLRAEANRRQDSSSTEQRTQAQVNQLDRAITSAGSRTVTLNFAAGGQRVGSVTALDDSQVNQLIDALSRAGYLTAG